MSQEPRRSPYCADSPYHLVLCSCVPPPPVLPQPPESSLTLFHDPLSEYLCASCPVVSRVFSALVTHPTAPPSPVSALVTTVAGFASSHRLDYAAHLVSGPARSPFSGGAPTPLTPRSLTITLRRSRINRDRAARTITLTQSHMVEQILTRFRFSFSKVQPTPLLVDRGLTAPPSNEPFESSGPYPELVGCLMYPTTCTRPDLAYILSVLARFVAPGRH
ncbi:unnamed protein product [Closterium sp. NIES-53]